MGALGTREGAGLAFLSSLDLSTDRCIEYPFGKFTSGYGRVRQDGTSRPAHVVSYEMHVGPVPPGLEVCHNCGNRPCVNPWHLRADTHRANMADCLFHGTHTRGARNGRARLTVDQVSYIRQQVAAGIQQKHLARDLGVHPQTVSRIIRGESWRPMADVARFVED